MGRKKNRGITPKQKALLEYIYKYSNEKNYAPSQQEIANAFGWRSLGTVQDYLKILIKKGVLEKKANFPRTLEVNTELLKWTSLDEDIKNIVISGKIAAGKPIEAITNTNTSTLPMPASMLPGENFYALEVDGCSMVEEGILSGDYIIIKTQENAEDGETVVALVENEATVKKIYRHSDKIELRPANSQMDSFWVDESECKIQGIVVGLYRSYN